MASKKWLVFVFVLVALLASLEYMPRNVLLRVAIPADASYPLNEGDTGTSMLWDRLRGEGYRVAIVYGRSGLVGLENVSDVVYLSVAGSTPVSDAVDGFQDIMDVVIGQGKRFHFILLDEAPTPQERAMLLRASNTLCGSEPPPISTKVLNNTIATLYAVINGRDYVVSTGYLGYIEVAGAPLAAPTRPVLPQPVQGYPRYVAFASSWPYPQEPYRGYWYIVGIRCTGGRGSVTVLMDSTIAVNLAAREDPRTLDLVVDLINTATSSEPSETLVIVDEELYAGAATGNVELILRLHPSVLLLAASSLYSRAEAAAAKVLGGQGLLWLIPLAAAMAILYSSWVSTPSSSRKRMRKERRVTGLRSRLRELTSPAWLGTWRASREACAKALELTSMIPSNAGDGDPRWAMVEYYVGRVKSTCSNINRVPYPLRLIPAWGWVRESVAVYAAEAVSLASFRPYEDVYREVVGGRGG